MTIKDGIIKLIEDSGIITHKKVIDILRGQGWKLSIAPYYYDNISNTVREIDIIAEKQFNLSSEVKSSKVQVNVQLFVECKYIKQEIVFWFDDRDIDKAVIKMEKSSDLEILHNRFGADITMDKFHYLTNDKVAKLFSTNMNKEDVIYKAITQCLNAQIYYDQWYNHPIHFDFSGHREVVTKILKYPIIICDNFNNLSKIDFNEDVGVGYKNELIKDSFQIETNYTFLDKAQKAKTEYFLIDLLNINDVGAFLDNLKKEVGFIISAEDGKRF
ncbi:MAG: hypothetical protein WCO84_02710 [bacterium]